MEYLTKNAGETQKLGKSLGSALIGGEIVALIGDLGSGKTTFVQGLAQGIGISRAVNSPTFIIMRHYTLSSDLKKIENVYHVDLYRLKEFADTDIVELGIPNLWNNPHNIFIIEWADRIKTLPSNAITVSFHNDKHDENVRQIEIKNLPYTLT